jgi:threonine dehydrogenase-like Zn-dependent dehydrogenase
MEGLHFPGGRVVERITVEDPTPAAGEVVVEIKASGMCGSELKFFRAADDVELNLQMSKDPIIAGHEPCGIIAAVGPGTDPRQAKVGDRVMVYHYTGCGVCEHCSVGWAHLCREQPIVIYGVNGHGSHAPYMKMPLSCVVPLPDGLSFEAGAAISCGTGTAYSALRRIGLSGRDTIAIFGQGPAGLSATLLASAMGARVIALDLSSERLERAKEFGAEFTLDPTKTDPVEAIKEITGGKGASRTLEVAGSEEARHQAALATATWGTLCLVGEGGDLKLDVTLEIGRIQLNIVGSWTFSSHIQREAAEFAVRKDLPIDKFFTAKWTLDQAEEAYREFDSQTTGKAVFLF